MFTKKELKIKNNHAWLDSSTLKTEIHPLIFLGQKGKKVAFNQMTYHYFWVEFSQHIVTVCTNFFPCKSRCICNQHSTDNGKEPNSERCNVLQQLQQFSLYKKMPKKPSPLSLKDCCLNKVAQYIELICYGHIKVSTYLLFHGINVLHFI